MSDALTKLEDVRAHKSRKEIGRRALRGDLDAEIANDLSLSLKTVSVELSNLRRLGVDIPTLRERKVARSGGVKSPPKVKTNEPRGAEHEQQLENLKRIQSFWAKRGRAVTGHVVTRRDALGHVVHALETNVGANWSPNDFSRAGNSDARA